MPEFYRGATVFALTNFFDYTTALAQPAGAVINVVYRDDEDVQQTEAITMTPGSSVTPWVAAIDTRDFAPGPVYWSIHTVAPVPASVEDGQFILLAGPANLETF